MTKTNSAFPQNQSIYDEPSLTATESSGVWKNEVVENLHLLRQKPENTTPNKLRENDKLRWGPACGNIKAALRSEAKLPANWSSAPLLAVLSTYYKRKPQRLEQDLAQRPKLGEFLTQDKSKLAFKQAQLTEQDYNNFIKELKKAGHGIRSHLPDQLKTVWRSTQKGSEAQQVARHSAPQHDRVQPANNRASYTDDTSDAATTPGLRTDNAPNKSDDPDFDDLNPFADDDDTSDTATTQGLKTDNAPNKSDDPDFDDLNPFADDDDTSDTATTQGLRTDNAPNKSTTPDLDKLNPLSDAEADSVAQTPRSYGSTLSPDATPSEEEHLPGIFLQLLNTYLKTKNGHSFGKINPAHVEKIKKDIAKNTTIGKHLLLENEQLKWIGNNVTKEDLQSLLDAFKTRHETKGSLYQVLSQFSLVKSGFQMLDPAAHQEIIQKAAQPAAHRPGKSEVVEMKRAAMTEALQHFSAPQKHKQPLPAGVLNDLIEHYGRTEQDRKQLQKSLEDIKTELTLNDAGLLEAIKRSLHLVKTKERLENFSQEVTTLNTKLRTNMLSWLDRVQTQHSSKAVATRTLEMLNQHLKKAHDDYASKIPGTNIYPEGLNDATAEQVENQARQNSHAVLKEIIAGHEKKFVDSLTAAVSSFSVPDYFKGKSREKAVDNIIAINETLASLYEIAQKHRQENILQIAHSFPDLDIQEEMQNDFKRLQEGLADNIRAKVLNNYKDVFNLYDKDLESIEVARSGDFSTSLFNSQALAKLSKELAQDIAKVRSTSYESCPNLKGKDLAPHLDQAVQEVTKPLLQKIRDRLPKVESIGQTLKSAFIRAFKPTPTRILGGIPLVGGLAFALNTLPKVIAIPLGITAAAVLPFALVGWVGWNIYKRFDQRSQIEHLHTQTLKNLEALESITTK